MLTIDQSDRTNLISPEKVKKEESLKSTTFASVSLREPTNIKQASTQEGSKRNP